MKDGPISRRKAIRRLLDAARPPEPVALSPMDCVGLVAAADISAGCDVPERASSVRDGYAVRSADITASSGGRPTVLRVTHTVRAESGANRPVEPGTTARVLTGGMIPPGADAVLAQEDVTSQGCAKPDPCRAPDIPIIPIIPEIPECIEVREPVRPGWFVRAAGGEIARGHTIVRQGCEITPQAAAVMIRTRIETVPVHPRPCARVVALGSELSDPTFSNAPGGDSPTARFPADNLVMASGLLARCGLERIETGVLPDSEERLVALLSSPDLPEIVITTGGTGRSERDFARVGARRAGFVTLFDSLDIRPGRNMFAAHRGNTLLFGLPGPPAAVFACFHAVILPAVRCLRGLAEPAQPLTARLDTAISTRPGGEWLALCSLKRAGACMTATPLTGPDSPPMLAMALAHGAVVLEGGEALLPGDEVEALTTLY
jgi:molybdopterin molybdotransferase